MRVHQKTEEEGNEAGDQVINQISLVSHGRKKFIRGGRALGWNVHVDVIAVFPQGEDKPNEEEEDQQFNRRGPEKFPNCSKQHSNPSINPRRSPETGKPLSHARFLGILNYIK